MRKWALPIQNISLLLNPRHEGHVFDANVFLFVSRITTNWILSNLLNGQSKGQERTHNILDQNQHRERSRY